jgi:hypothetical protein
MSEKISGVCKVWRGEYGFLLTDDGSAVFCITANASAAVSRPPKPVTNSSSKSSVAVKVCALSQSAMSDR